MKRDEMKSNGIRLAFYMIWTIVTFFSGTSLAGINEPTALIQSGISARALVLDPEDSNILYCLVSEKNFGISNNKYSVHNRVPAKSVDGGATWMQMTDGLPLEKLCQQRNRYDILVGTAFASQTLYFTTQTDITENTVYRMDLSLGKWEQVGESHDMIHCLTVKPDDPEVVLISLGREPGNSIRRSADGGKTWSIVFDVTSAECLAFSPADYNLVLAGTSHVDHRIIKSSDAGQSWQVISGDGVFGSGIRQVTSDPLDPDIIYVATYSNNYPYQFRKTVDGGVHWANFGPENPTPAHGIYINPSDPQNIICKYYPNVAYYVTHDGGENWKVSLGGIKNPYYTTYLMENLVISLDHPPVIYACGGGLLKSYDEGDSYELLSPYFLESESFAHKTYVCHSDFNKLVTVIDGVGIFKSDDFGRKWVSAINGINTIKANLDISWDAADLNKMYLIGIYNGMNHNLYSSLDAGASWTKLNPEYDIRRVFTSQSKANCVYAIRVVSYGETTNAVIGRREALLKSDDNGQTWVNVTPPGLGIITGFIDSPTDVSILYSLGILVDGDPDQKLRLYKSLDMGENWQETELWQQDLEYWSINGIIMLNHQNPDEIMTEDYYSLVISRDGGTSWSKIDNPNFKGGYDDRSILFDNYRQDTLYADGYRSVDNGQTWSDEPVFSPIYSDAASGLLIDDHGNCMTIQDTPPRICLGGLNVIPEMGSSLMVYAFAQDSDPFDYVTTVKVLYDNEFLGYGWTLYDNGACCDYEDGFFVLNYPLAPCELSNIELQLLAKDRFGNSSTAWPSITISK